MSFYQNLKNSEDRLVAYRTRWYALHEERYTDETLPSTLYRMSPAVTRRSIIVNWLWVAWTAFLLPMSLFDIGEHPEATVITSGLVVAFISAAVFTRRFPNLQAVGESPVMSTPKAVVIWTAVKLGIVFGLYSLCSSQVCSTHLGRCLSPSSSRRCSWHWRVSTFALSSWGIRL